MPPRKKRGSKRDSVKASLTPASQRRARRSADNKKRAKRVARRAGEDVSPSQDAAHGEAAASLAQPNDSPEPRSLAADFEATAHERRQHRLSVMRNKGLISGSSQQSTHEVIMARVAERQQAAAEELEQRLKEQDEKRAQREREEAERRARHEQRLKEQAENRARREREKAEREARHEQRLKDQAEKRAEKAERQARRKEQVEENRVRREREKAEKRAQREREKAERERIKQQPGGKHYKAACNNKNFDESSIQGPNIVNGRFNIGEMDEVCPFCHALMFRREATAKLQGRSTFGMCCSHGQVQLAPWRDPPEPLKTWLHENPPSEQAKQFLKHIRRYNSILMLASAVSKVNPEVKRLLGPGRGRGPSSYRVGGNVYHLLGPMHPIDGERPGFAQLYCHDTDHETENRMQVFQGLNQQVLRELQGMLHQHNHLVREFQRASTREDQELGMVILDDAGRGVDQRRYNAPSAAEVAVIIPGEEFEPGKRDIVVRRRPDPNRPNNRQLQIISNLHPAFEPLHFVLMFPYGQPGWHLGIPRQPRPTALPEHAVQDDAAVAADDDDDDDDDIIEGATDLEADLAAISQEQAIFDSQHAPQDASSSGDSSQDDVDDDIFDMIDEAEGAAGPNENIADPAAITFEFSDVLLRYDTSHMTSVRKGHAADALHADVLDQYVRQAEGLGLFDNPRGHHSLSAAQLYVCHQKWQEMQDRGGWGDLDRSMIDAELTAIQQAIDVLSVNDQILGSGVGFADVSRRYDETYVTPRLPSWKAHFHHDVFHTYLTLAIELDLFDVPLENQIQNDLVKRMQAWQALQARGGWADLDQSMIDAELFDIEQVLHPHFLGTEFNFAWRYDMAMCATEVWQPLMHPDVFFEWINQAFGDLFWCEDGPQYHLLSAHALVERRNVWEGLKSRSGLGDVDKKFIEVEMAAIEEAMASTYYQNMHFTSPDRGRPPAMPAWVSESVVHGPLRNAFDRLMDGN